jgi:hypothetical protein
MEFHLNPNLSIEDSSATRSGSKAKGEKNLIFLTCLHVDGRAEKLPHSLGEAFYCID